MIKSTVRSLPGDTVIGFSGGTGHNQSVGTFDVLAGDILELDAFYYQGSGGHSGEISLAQGTLGAFTNTSQFNLLQDDMFGGAVRLHTSVSEVVPEPTTIALWSLLGIGLLSYRRWRRS